MKVGVFAKTFMGSTPMEVISAAQRAGYGAVQYNMACSGLPSLPETISSAAADAVREAACRTNVEIAAVSATYNMIHPDLQVREAGRRSFNAIAAAAQRMGTRLLTVCTGSRDVEDQWRRHRDNSTASAWRDMLDEFRHLIEIAERTDVLIGVEPELANVVDSASKAKRMVNTLRSDRIRIVLDPANLLEAGTPEHRRAVVAEAVDLLADRIELAHAKDRYNDDRFAPAGDGVVDFPHFITALQKTGFGGALIAHGLVVEDAGRVATFLRATLTAAGCFS
jgi:sugar phosphate isomerase/epimerase